MNGGQPIGVDSPCKLDQCGPQPSVNIADFAIDETTNQNLPCLSERSRDFPNLLSFSVSPPASANWDPGNRFSQIWNRTVSGLQHNTSIFHELNRVLCGHRVREYNRHQSSATADSLTLWTLTTSARVAARALFWLAVSCCFRVLLFLFLVSCLLVFIGGQVAEFFPA